MSKRVSGAGPVHGSSFWGNLQNVSYALCAGWTTCQGVAVPHLTERVKKGRKKGGGEAGGFP